METHFIEPAAGRLLIVAAPHAAQSALLEMTAELACRGPLLVLDGGNQFNAYHVARAVRRRTPTLEATLQRIILARAFTCYQLAALIADAVLAAEPAPLLVLDFLATFNDENVPLIERRWLLEKSLAHLRRISQRSTAALSVRLPDPGEPERAELFEMVRAAADQVWQMEAALPTAQPRLFE
jgi:hypothetical protein